MKPWRDAVQDLSREKDIGKLVSGFVSVFHDTNDTSKMMKDIENENPPNYLMSMQNSISRLLTTYQSITQITNNTRKAVEEHEDTFRKALEAQGDLKTGVERYTQALKNAQQVGLLNSKKITEINTKVKDLAQQLLQVAQVLAQPNMGFALVEQHLQAKRQAVERERKKTIITAEDDLDEDIEALIEGYSNMDEVKKSLKTEKISALRVMVESGVDLNYREMRERIQKKMGEREGGVYLGKFQQAWDNLKKVPDLAKEELRTRKPPVKHMTLQKDTGDNVRRVVAEKAALAARKAAAAPANPPVRWDTEKKPPKRK